MGVSITIWRARIGCFTGSYQCKNSAGDLNNVIENSSCSKCSFLPVFAIAYLLLIGGIESNPGPDLEDLITQNQNTLLDAINSSKLENIEAVNSLKTTIEELTAEVSGMKKTITDSSSRISKLERVNSDLLKKIDQMDNNSRKNNIIVFGLPESTDSNINVYDEFISFVEDKLDVYVSSDELSNAYRIGKNPGNKRPLFVQFTRYKHKVEIMKNVNKLKNTSISISDDLTPTARAMRKVLLKNAADARNAGHNVKIRNNFLIVDSTIVQPVDFDNARWLENLQHGAGSSTAGDRKRQRTETSSPQGIVKEARHVGVNSNDRPSRSQENSMPPPHQSEGGGMRSRSSSRGKKGK